MKLKKILPILIIVLVILTWYTSVSSIITAPFRYNGYLKNAKKYEKEERYQYAIEEYEKAIAYKPDNKELYEKEVEDYKKLKDTDSMLARCDYIISNFKDNEKAYLIKMDYYKTEESLSDLAETVKAAHAEHPDNKDISKIYKEIKGDFYEEYATYTYIARFRAKGALIENEDGLYGIVNPDGSVQVQPKYDFLTLYSNKEKAKENLASVKNNNELYYMDSKGYKALVNSDKYDFLGEISENVMVVGKKDKYGFAYWNEDERRFDKKTDLKWDAATVMFNGVAAVCKDGKWAIIGSDYKEITKYNYSDVKVDDYGLCSVNNLIFVKEGEKYKLLDTDGEEITKAIFDDAKPFVGGEYAAVCQKGKWGFVNSEGDIVIKCEYDGADSFSSLYAPVMKDGKWGYIDKKNQLIYDYQFDEAKQFNENAIAPVFINGVWKLIHAYIYE